MDEAPLTVWFLAILILYINNQADLYLDFRLDGFVFAIMMYDSESSRGDGEIVISSSGYVSSDFGTFF